MRLSWFTGSQLLRRRAGRLGRRSAAAKLRVRQLERRRVLDAATASVVVSAVTSTESTTPPPAAATTTDLPTQQPLTFNWTPTPGTESQTANSSELAPGAAVNTPPFLLSQPDQNANEGELFDLSGLSGAPVLGLYIESDLGDTHTATVNWGDGSLTESATVFEGVGSGALGGTHTYTDQGTYTVTVVVKDSYGDTDTDSFDVLVAPVNPTATLGNSGPVVEGSSATVSFTNQFDPSSADTTAGFHYAYDIDNNGTFDVGDGTYAGSGTSTSQNISSSLLAEGPADYTVKARIIDKDGQFTDYTTTIHVNNAAPTLTEITGDTIDENGIATIGATIVDPSTSDVFSVKVDWKDGSTATISGLGAGPASGTVGDTTYQWDGSTRSLQLSHKYLDDGPTTLPVDTYKVVLSVSDDDLDSSGPYGAEVVVNNVPPFLIAQLDQQVFEGDVLDLSGLSGAPTLALFVDPGTLDTHTATVNWGDGSPVENATVFAGVGSGAIGGTHVYADDGQYKVTVTVTDKDGGSDTESFFVQVNTVVPTLIVPGPQMVEEGTPLTITNIGTITDQGFDNPDNPNEPPSGSVETFTYWINWGDGNIDTGSATIDDVGAPFDLTDASFDGSHTYANDGPYTITIRIADDNMTGNFVGGLNTVDYVEQTIAVTVTNDVPELAGVTGSTIQENGTGTVSATIVDAGAQDVFSVDVNWQDGTSDTITGLGSSDVSSTIGGTTYVWTAATRELQLSHPYLDDGTSPGNNTTQDDYGVTLLVHDEADTGVQQTATVTVQNVAPQLSDPSDVTIFENGTATLTTTITDPGTQDVFSVDVNWQDGTSNTITGLGLSNASGTVGGTDYVWTADTRELKVSHKYLDDGASPGNGTIQDDYAVALTVHDDDLGTGTTQTATVTVQNVAPQISDPTDTTILENGTATLTTTITDPGTQDVFSVDVNWQDGTNNTISGLGLSNASGTVGTTDYVWNATTRVLSVSHKYLDDGVSPGNGTIQDDYAVALTVHDDDLGTGTVQSATVTVQNVAPQISDPTDTTILENGTATLTTTITDPGTQDVFSVDVNWQDGTSNTITGLGLSNASGTVGSTDYVWTAATRELKVSHKYLDDGVSPGNGTIQDDYAATLTVHDDDLGTGLQQTATVTVQNVVPQISDPTDTTIFENGIATLTTTITDAGTQDVFSVDVNWQDGTNNTITGLGLANATGTVGGTDYVWTAATRELKVSHKYLDDGASPGNGTVQDDYAVSLTVHDDDLGTGNVQSATVTVQNVAPQISDPTDTTIFENGTATLTTTITDPGTQDVFSVDVNWQDGTSNTITGLGLSNASGTVGTTDYVWNATTRELKVSHKYLDDGVSPGNGTNQDDYAVSLTVHDDDLGTGTTQTATVTVQNVAPQISDPTDTTILENGTATLTTTITDPGTQDVFSVDVNWQDGTNNTITGLGLSNAAGTVGTTDYVWNATTRVLSVSHKYLDDGVSPGNGTIQDDYAVALTVHDDDLGTGTVQSATVTVQNVVPQISDPSDTTILENGTATLTTTITDPGTQDVFSVDVNWQDGTSNTITGLGLSNASGTVGGTDYVWNATTRVLSVSHKYLDDGVSPGNGTIQDDYAVALTVHDDDLGTGVTQLATVTVQNVAPQISDPTDTTIFENGTATLTTTITDPGTQDVFSVDVNWQDGTSNTITGLGLSNASGTVGTTDYVWNATTRVLSVSHKYLDDGVSPGNGTTQDDYAVALTVHDDDLGTGTVQSATVTVQNVAPQISDPTDTTIFENGTATLTTTITDPGTQDVFSVDVNWQDGTNNTITGLGLSNASGTVGTTDYVWNATTRVLSVSHKYLDDGASPGNGTIQDDYAVALTVHDDDLGTGLQQTATVTVQNVAPQISDPSDTTILENGTATLTTTITDPGTQDVFSVDVNWQDGTNNTITGLGLSNAAGTVGTTDYVWNATTRVLSVSHKYLDDGISPGNGTIQDDYAVALTVHDDDLGTGTTQTATVTVQNVAPQISDPADVSINEHDTVTLTTTVTDPGSQDVFSIDVNWQDGANNTITGLGLVNASGTVGKTDYVWTAATRELKLSHQYVDDGASPGNGTIQDDYAVALTIHDDDLGTGSVQTTTVTVKNVTPSVTLTPVSDINENGVATLKGSYTDIGLVDGHTLTVNWDDPNNASNSTFEVRAIQNAAGVTTLAVGDTFDSSTDDAVLTITAINTANGQVSFSVQHQYLDDGLAPGNGTTSDVSTIGVTAADDDAQSGSKTTTITVHNVAPEFKNVAGDSINEGTVATVSMNFSDPGQLDVFTANVDWRDGSTATITGLGSVDASGVVGNTTYEWTAASRELTVSHLYADNANYQVIVRVADDDMAANFAGVAGPSNFTGTTTSVNVANVAPTLAGTTSLTVNEGSALTLNGLGVHLEDVGFDNPANQTPPPLGNQFQETFTSYTIDWGDGTSDTPVNVVMRVSGSPGVPTTALFDHAAHTYADNGVYTVRVRVADDNMSGNFTSGTDGVDYVDLKFTITVTNVAPTLAVPAPSAANINENGSVNFTVSFSDPGFDNHSNDNAPPNGGETDETFTYDIDWGDGRHTVSNVTVVATPGGVGVKSAGSFGESHIYADDGDYTVTVKIHDDDGGIDTQTFVVSVHNTDPVIVTPLNGDDVTAQGITRIRFAFSDLGFDNPANQTPPPNGNQFAETFTYVVDWGDGTVDTITVSQVSPGSPVVVNSQTMVLSSARTSGGEGVSTTGSFEVEHKYAGPPDPLHPTADIIITVTLIDDNGGTVSDAIAITNPGIDVVNVAIDTTPDVPRLEYTPQQMVQVFLDRQTTTPQTLQTLNTRVASSELTLTSDRYLELNVISPDGKVVAQYRLKDEALTDLRGLIATLPDGHYKIYLVRTDNNSRRLVLDVNVRQGRVVDPSDDSEGTRDRPPIEGGQQNQAQPLENNPQLQRVQEQNPPAAMNDSSMPVDQVSTMDEVTPVVAAEVPSSSRLRWAAPLAGLGLVAQRGSWSREVDAAFDKADEQAWQRLRRAGRRRLVK